VNEIVSGAQLPMQKVIKQTL